MTQTILVNVPKGSVPGTTIQVQAPDGRIIYAQVPPGVDQFHVSVPDTSDNHNSNSSSYHLFQNHHNAESQSSSSSGYKDRHLILSVILGVVVGTIAVSLGSWAMPYIAATSLSCAIGYGLGHAHAHSGVDIRLLLVLMLGVINISVYLASSYTQ